MKPTKLGPAVLLLALALLTLPGAFSQNQSVPVKTVLEPYTTCSFTDGLRVVQVDPLGSGIASRTVDTISGAQRIDIAAGFRVMFAYPDTDFYANVKAESLPSTSYEAEKQSLLDNLQYLHMTSPGTTLREKEISSAREFEIHGFDRDHLEGGVLGFYLIFDDSHHVATTVYLLNQEPESRKFSTIEQYRTLRDRFLDAYTSCIRTNQKHQP